MLNTIVFHLACQKKWAQLVVYAHVFSPHCAACVGHSRPFVFIYIQSAIRAVSVHLPLYSQRRNTTILCRRILRLLRRSCGFRPEKHDSPLDRGSRVPTEGDSGPQALHDVISKNSKHNLGSTNARTDNSRRILSFPYSHFSNTATC